MHGHRRIGLLAAGAALTASMLGAGAAVAATPATDSWTNHYAGPALDCPTFTAYGDWVINHSLTVYLDTNGEAQGDLERVEFAGRFYNPSTGTSVADRGSKRFRDTFAADGSYASTVMTYQRTDQFVHEAGRVVLGPQDANGDQAELRSVGHEGFNDAGVAALCTALDK
ncbi:MAG: hypothetical protein ABI573_06690 [Chloroflexota bacterium]